MEEELLIPSPQNNNSSRLFKGAGCLLGALSGTFFTFANAFSKLIDDGFDSSIVSLLGSCFICIYCAVMAVYRKRNVWKYSTKDYLSVTAMGLVNGSAMILHYKGVKFICLADSITLMASSPIFVVLINLLILRIKVSAMEVIQLVVCVAGCLLCAQPSFIFGMTGPLTGAGIFGYCSALTLALEIGVFNIFVKQNYHIDQETLLFVTYATGIPCMMMYIASFVELQLPGNYISFWYLLGCGASILVATVLLCVALSHDTSVMVVIGRTAEIAVGFVLDLLLFNAMLNWLSVVGGIVVMLGIAIPAIINAMTSRQEETPLQ